MASVSEAFWRVVDRHRVRLGWTLSDLKRATGSNVFALRYRARKGMSGSVRLSTLLSMCKAMKVSPVLMIKEVEMEIIREASIAKFMERELSNESSK